MPLPSRLFPITKVVFDAINLAGTKGIIVGGAAAHMFGSKRVTTRDVDINVLSFPEFPEDPMIKARFPFDDDNSIMKITYLDSKEAVKADVATRRAQHIPLLLKYSLTDPKTNFTYANYQLLLADKIRTLAERGEKKDKKRETDLADIKFCIEEMFMRDEKCLRTSNSCTLRRIGVKS
ncbi:uncharacterized protein LACBIDRAFT_333076 [Laccaria bicolor S238N-H82]|uniref:Predicted protein n=1 Tax=Laccaria bicolor (strain S238N-H82 / ATCC MYA-4686) TaxID=486041 RepID=B0DUS7_LACBS|nr:uncharacterized protein LACBIDRAFT_333076 [Laccaria bicolor S238N-H82]EDR01596.1 predicted protein [Laccaria bicolor S238N-H82]|eukprot:XP_001887672.1 predicted protein [Laccaria bicolor S238N-H82]